MDHPLTRLAVLAVVTALAVVGAVWSRRRGGRPRAQRRDVRLTAEDLGAGLGGRATLVQFSQRSCAPCRPARRVLAEVAASTPGVVHVDVDAGHRLDLAQRFGVLTTPTTLVTDRHGEVTHRLSGVPDAAALRRLLDGPLDGTGAPPPDTGDRLGDLPHGARR